MATRVDVERAETQYNGRNVVIYRYGGRFTAMPRAYQSAPRVAGIVEDAGMASFILGGSEQPIIFPWRESEDDALAGIADIV
jgi:hypothetical protein